LVGCLVGLVGQRLRLLRVLLQRIRSGRRVALLQRIGGLLDRIAELLHTILQLIDVLLLLRIVAGRARCRVVDLILNSLEFLLHRVLLPLRRRL
jgi:hypothetical protein